MRSRDERKPCIGETKVHDDAMTVVNFIEKHGGVVKMTNEEIASKVMFWQEQGRTRTLNMGRFYRARNHARDRVDGERNPCCIWTLHYRDSSADGSILALIDPNGDLGSHAFAVIGSVRGFVLVQKQQHTENLRNLETFQLLGDHALANGDRHGYGIVQRAVIDMERDGTIRPDTMAQLEVWMSSLNLTT